ncbi:LysM peptidoglycan-binding domain-containing protein [Galbitalea soli]|uniref:LysM peptidoglycan-binding domain-containing protein n=2 Tax=Galbitalea soli TaxID=1268042 RepID=A0A7C9TNZ9_9MICO|nr:LysM peptidoglycan-binding domain-containing protein [Galbitalea soli]
MAAANATAASTPDESAGQSAARIDTASVPSTYVVRGGDTVSSIATHHGLSTASVLALNGLSWKSIIFPGQVLKLTKSATSRAPKPPAASPTAQTVGGRYTIRAGDTLYAISKRFAVSLSSLLSANHLTVRSTIYAGRTLVIPKTSTASVGTPTPVTAPVVAPVVVPAPTGSGSAATYVIRTGDTITSIATQFGVSVPAILAANNLGPSSIIYAGRTLVIPGIITTASVGTTITPLSPTMRANAQIIVAVGRQLGVPDYGIIIALAAAAQESGLQNIDYGDRDSVGLFQQRPSTGWGAKAQLLDPSYASRLFFGGPSNPNRGVTRGLLDVPNWQKLTVTQAAQSVQISAFPNAYAKWETSARAWFNGLK